ncbi:MULTISPECIES: PLD nuclease N-terminal domain-containing protein [unclassified Amycolatopsis]|uniref:PLD nuclease N-terminal domain-containing protein n=1 Tax=unclassified Amycolatopsis TaxID=2618356 RepID=UPI001C69C1BD|nr:PLD nuclease N-terminal domain-containing protein [Amycolatopsis sp. DSM 110486]QYN20293.1 PLD nuclease N-terminal domain-containing protein [Amycolatopsis sp. DSM 110486]
MNSPGADRATRRRWADLSPAERRVVAGAAAVQVSLAATAWWDLTHRPAEQVRGPKAVWAAVIAVNFAGPLAYFRWGRLRPGCQGPVERGPSAPE